MVTVMVVVALVMLAEVMRRLMEARHAEARVPVRIDTPRRSRRR